MANMCKEDEHSTDNPEVDVIDLMSKKLPPYVVNCLVT